MQHCRRKFVDVIKISEKKKSGAAYLAVQFIQKLYRLEEKTGYFLAMKKALALQLLFIVYLKQLKRII